MLEKVGQKVPMPDFMKEQMPDLMPRAMDNLLPHMLPNIVPLITQPLIDYLRGKGGVTAGAPPGASAVAAVDARENPGVEAGA